MIGTQWLGTVCYSFYYISLLYGAINTICTQILLKYCWQRNFQSMAKKTGQKLLNSKSKQFKVIKKKKKDEL